eukprot:10773428-Karenia_brevis.AAC.1
MFWAGMPSVYMILPGQYRELPEDYVEMLDTGINTYEKIEEEALHLESVMKALTTIASDKKERPGHQTHGHCRGGRGRASRIADGQKISQVPGQSYH